jgi:endonuclease YncB( thermonuclease family)
MPSASHPSSGRAGSPRSPRVRRPAGPTLDTIERDGISWEGEVVIVGHDGDIPALLFVTSDRILLTNGDTILLEAPRSWLLPAPLRVEESGVRLSITPEGVVPGRGATERLLLMVGDGRGPATQLVAILTGRARRQRIEAELPTWKDGVGAGRSSSLPPLPAFEMAQDAPRPEPRETGDAETRGVAPIDAWAPSRRESQQQTPEIPFRAPEPEPVEPQSNAARFLSTRPVTQEAEEPTPKRRPAAQVTPIARERQQRRRGAGAWLGWVALLTIVALVGGWFARPWLPAEVTDRLPAAIVGEQAGDDGDVALQPQTAPQQPSTDANHGDGTNGAGANPTDIMPTEAALGVGGATSDIPGGTGGGESGPDGSVLPTPTPPAEPAGNETAGEAPAGTGGNETLNGEVEAPADTTEQQPVDTGEQPEAPQPTETTGQQPADVVETQPAPTEPPVVVAPTEAPTDVPVEETPVPTEIPTEEPTVAPTEIATEAPTEVPTEIPTEVVTEAPVELPATPTAAPEESPEPTIAPEEEPVTEPTLESQPPSVNPEEPPAQEFVQSGIRYSVEGASTGGSVPELPEINAVTYGEWIVLAVDGQNLTGENQVFDMREFTLIADGEPIQVDVGNSWVASMLGYSPAYGNTDAILWAPGEEHQFALTFLAPLDAQSLVLQAGDQQLDLGDILDTTPALGQMRQTAAPETIDATVVDVLDGETIVIEKDGIQQTVRYLGIDVPTGDACYAAEATDANRALVAGKVVKIERQATDVDAQGNWVRDVWVEQEDGRFALVAHQLVEEGAATADISEPNTRFATWLRSADAAAHAEGRGLWGGCQQGSAPASAPVTVQPADLARRTTA